MSPGLVFEPIKGTVPFPSYAQIANQVLAIWHLLALVPQVLWARKCGQYTVVCASCWTINRKGLALGRIIFLNKEQCAVTLSS